MGPCFPGVAFLVTGLNSIAFQPMWGPDVDVCGEFVVCRGSLGDLSALFIKVPPGPR